MSIAATFHLDGGAYREKARSQDPRILRKKHHAKTIRSVTTSMGAGSSIVAAFFTCGISLIPAAYLSRQNVIARKQADIIEEILIEMEEEVPRIRKRDLAAGATIGTISIGLGVFVPGLVEGATSGIMADAAGAAMAANSGIVTDLASGTIALDQVASNAADGAEYVLKSEAHQFVSDPGISSTPLPAPVNINAPGWAAGAQAVILAERIAAKEATMYAVTEVVEKGVSRKL